MRRVTINDVARLAGVSIKSVSRVVNDEPNIRPALRLKVEEAIEALGYKPNPAARSLAAGRSFAIGVLFDNPSPSYTMKVQEGAYAACHRAGYQLVIEHVHTAGPDVAGVMAAMLANRRLDGMVVTPPATDRAVVLDALEQYRTRYIRIAPNSFPGRSPSISSNDGEAVGQAVRHLWGLGHRRFGLIDGPPAHGASQWRRQGYVSALERQGLAEAEILCADGDFTFASGIRAGRLLLAANPRPTAIFAANDDMAAGLFAAAAQMGIGIPDGLSVVGFDNSWIATTLWPELTTLHQPIAEMAFDAVEMLIASKSEGDSPAARLQDCELVIRGSTAQTSP